MNVFILFVGISSDWLLPAIMSMSIKCVTVTSTIHSTMRYDIIRRDVDDVKRWWSCVGSTTWLMWCKTIHSRVDNLHFASKVKSLLFRVIYANCIALQCFSILCLRTNTKTPPKCLHALNISSWWNIEPKCFTLEYVDGKEIWVFYWLILWKFLSFLLKC